MPMTMQLVQASLRSASDYNRVQICSDGNDGGLRAMSAKSLQDPSSGAPTRPRLLGFNPDSWSSGFGALVQLGFRV